MIQKVYMEWKNPLSVYTKIKVDIIFFILEKLIKILRCRALKKTKHLYIYTYIWFSTQIANPIAVSFWYQYINIWSVSCVHFPFSLFSLFSDLEIAISSSLTSSLYWRIVFRIKVWVLRVHITLGKSLFLDYFSGKNLGNTYTLNYKLRFYF